MNLLRPLVRSECNIYMNHITLSCPKEMRHLFLLCYFGRILSDNFLTSVVSKHFTVYDELVLFRY